MKRMVVILALLVASAVISLRARAQDVPETDVTTSVVFHAECDCVVAEAEFYYSYTGPMDYDVNESTDLTDANGTVNDHQSIPGYVDEYNEQADNVVWGDSYNFSAEIDAECDPIAQPGGCEGGGGGGRGIAGCCCSPRCGICGGGCCFANCGSGCSCEDGPPGGSPNDVESNSGANIGNSCGEGPQLDYLVNEYVSHSFAPGTVEGTTWASLWDTAYGITCASFTGGNPTPYAGAFSSGDPSAGNWAVFQTPLVQGVAGINQAPPAFTGLASAPQPSGTNTVYRTPYEAYLNGPTHPNEPHQMGAAVDYGAGNSTIFGYIAAWAEYQTGSNSGETTVGTVCVEPPNLDQPNPYDHVHVDWRPEFGQGCLTDWQKDYIPTGWPSH